MSLNKYTKGFVCVSSRERERVHEFMFTYNKMQYSYAYLACCPEKGSELGNGPNPEYPEDVREFSFSTIHFLHSLSPNFHLNTVQYARPDFAELDVFLGQHILLTLEQHFNPKIYHFPTSKPNLNHE